MPLAPHAGTARGLPTKYNKILHDLHVCVCVFTQIFGTAKYNLLKIQLKTHTLPHKIAKKRYFSSLHTATDNGLHSVVPFRFLYASSFFIISFG